MKKIFTLLLGIVTSIGGFVEAGSISTAAQAGSEFGFSLLWAIAAATLILSALSEMCGRMAAVGKRTLVAGVRERFGINFQIVPLGAELAIDLLLLTAELGSAAVALKLVTGVSFPWWVVPLAAVAMALLWLGSFSVIEDGVGLLGLVTLAFVLAAWRLHPDGHQLARGFVPTVPQHDGVRYAFLAVGIVGATISPYLLNFYSSGAIEEEWTSRDLWINRMTSLGGMSFGGIVSMGVLVTSAIVLGPLHVRVESFEQASAMFAPVFGRWAVPLFAAGLGIGCFGAAVEIALNAGYLLAQSFGWAWGVEKPRSKAARFTLAFSLMLATATLIAVSGIDPLKVTMVSVALTVVIAPLIVLPLLVLMNDRNYVGAHTNGAFGNGFVAAVTILTAVMALIVIPLEIVGG